MGSPVFWFLFFGFLGFFKGDMLFWFDACAGLRCVLARMMNLESENTCLGPELMSYDLGQFSFLES